MRVKICGITREEDARTADAAGADAIGVVLFSDSPREVDEDQAARIFRSVGPFTATVCVSHTDSQDELQAMLALHPTAIQISYPFEIPRSEVKIIRVIEPGADIPRDGDAVIVDASRGTGRLFNQKFAQSLISTIKKPVILAGGLTPENVREAITTLHPYAVDVASGVEIRPGIKDPEKIQRFVRNARLPRYAAGDREMKI